MTVHLRMRVKGDPAKVETFHKAMVEMDSDYPYAIVGNHKLDHRTHECKACGGRAYDNPRLSAADIKRLAPQFGVKVKIRGFTPSWKCMNSSGMLTFVDRTDPSKSIVERENSYGTTSA